MKSMKRHKPKSIWITKESNLLKSLKFACEAPWRSALSAIFLTPYLMRGARRTGFESRAWLGFFFFALVFFYFRSLHFCPFPPKIILQTEMFNSPLNAKPQDVYENLSCYTSFPGFNTTLFFLSFLTYFTVRKHCPFSSKHYRPQLASTWSVE